MPLSRETIEELKKAGRQRGALQKHEQEGSMRAWSGPVKGAGGVSYGDRLILKGETGVDKTMMLGWESMNCIIAFIIALFFGVMKAIFSLNISNKYLSIDSAVSGQPSHPDIPIFFWVADILYHLNIDEFKIAY